MPFRKILTDVVSSVDGAVAALFVDRHGETVQIVGDLPAWDMKVIGAYQGIFLTRLEAACATFDDAPPRRLKVEWQRSLILNQAIDDEYYLVLVLRTGSNEGLAWRALGKGRKRLLEEM